MTKNKDRSTTDTFDPAAQSQHERDSLAGIERSAETPWRGDAQTETETPATRAAMNPTERLLQFIHPVKPTGGQSETVDRVRAAYQKLAEQLCRDVPPGAELTVAIRKLIESKDCAVRAILYP